MRTNSVPWKDEGPFGSSTLSIIIELSGTFGHQLVPGAVLARFWTGTQSGMASPAVHNEPVAAKTFVHPNDHFDDEDKCTVGKELNKPCGTQETSSRRRHLETQHQMVEKGMLFCWCFVANIYGLLSDPFSRQLNLPLL